MSRLGTYLIHGTDERQMRPWNRRHPRMTRVSESLPPACGGVRRDAQHRSELFETDPWICVQGIQQLQVDFIDTAVGGAAHVREPTLGMLIRAVSTISLTICHTFHYSREHRWSVSFT